QPVGLAVDEVSDLALDDSGGAQGLTVLEDGVARRVDLDALLQQAFAAGSRPARREGTRQAARAEHVDATPQISLLGFSLAGQAYALPLAEVREVIPAPEEIAILPRTDAAMVGVASLRGALLPIVSTRALLGLPGRAIT